MFCILTFFLFVFLTGNAVCEEPTKRDYWPTDGWKTSTPEMQGMDSAKLLIADEFISDRFLYDTVGKQMALKFLSGALPYTSEMKIIITMFESEGDEVKIDVWLKDKYFEAPFMTGTKLVKENGKWKWYGNQIRRLN